MSVALAKKIVPLARTVPNNPEAELGALSSATCSRAGLAEVLDRLTIDHFYVPAHQLLYAAFQEMERQGKPLEMIGLSDALENGLPVQWLPAALMRGRLERKGKPGAPVT